MAEKTVAVAGIVVLLGFVVVAWVVVFAVTVAWVKRLWTWVKWV